MSRLKEIGRVPTSEVERKQISQPILDAIEEYVELVMNNTKDAIARGMKEVVHELEQAEKSVWKISIPFAFEEYSEEIAKQLRDKTFEASQQTLTRLTGRVMDNLEESYREGLGIDDAADRLNEVFRSMEDYELVRVARTEINSAQNRGALVSEEELGVEYHQWWSAEDEDVRDSHLHMHGQIVKVGDEFSNGLLHPGDTGGPIEEWINCRCRIVPFLLPEGMTVPVGARYFYEEDLTQMPRMETKVDPSQLDMPEPYSEEVVNQYIERIRNNESIAPVFVDEANPRHIVDGLHRATAYQRLGMDVPVYPVNRVDALTSLAKPGMTPEKYLKQIQGAPRVAVEYQPVMSEEKAREWAKDSMVQENFYHGTSEVSQESILKNGFDPEIAMKNQPGPGAYGPGVYFGNESLATQYQKTGSPPLKVVLNVKKKATEDIVYSYQPKVYKDVEMTDLFFRVGAKNYDDAIKTAMEKGLPELVKDIEALGKEEFNHIMDIHENYGRAAKSKLWLERLVKDGYDYTIPKGYEERDTRIVVIFKKGCATVVR